MANSKKDEKGARAESKIVATNAKARRFYEILETYEAGLSLLGPEVKSLRLGRASLDGTFGRSENGELRLFNFYIPPYQYCTGEPPDPRRTRKLLLHGAEIRKIASSLRTKGLALVPLEVYFRRGWAKVRLALARGRKETDRREDLKKEAVRRETERSFRGRYRS